MTSASATSLAFGDACERARALSGRVWTAAGQEVGARLLIVLDNGESLCLVLLACWLAGVVPIVRSPPWLSHFPDPELLGVIAHSGARAVVVADGCALEFRAACPAGTEVWSFSRLCSETEVSLEQEVRASGERHLIQYSSGTTGQPTGIVLSETGIINNAVAIGVAVRASSHDTVVSWLPMSHDMGLIGSLIYSFVWGMSLIVMSPLSFVSKPVRWLWAISRFGGTSSAAPNFAYALCSSERRVPEESLSGLDLSSWRVAVNAAETVQADTVSAFVRRFSKYGFPAGAMCPAYGLAENSVACSIGLPGQAARVDTVQRDVLENTRVALPTEGSGRFARFVSVGTPVPGTDVRIVDANGTVVGERAVGEIQLRGTSKMVGYLDKAGATESPETWLPTGDLGYWANGELFVIGRSKQTIKRAGKTLDAGEMSDVVGRVAGVRRGCVSVFSVPNPELGTERVVVLAEVRHSGTASRRAVIDAVHSRFGMVPDELVFVASGALPKTTSGKLRIDACRALYDAGLQERYPGDAPLGLDVDSWET